MSKYWLGDWPYLCMCPIKMNVSVAVTHYSKRVGYWIVVLVHYNINSIYDLAKLTILLQISQFFFARLQLLPFPVLLPLLPYSIMTSLLESLGGGAGKLTCISISVGGSGNSLGGSGNSSSLSASILQWSAPLLNKLPILLEGVFLPEGGVPNRGCFCSRSCHLHSATRRLLCGTKE